MPSKSDWRDRRLSAFTELAQLVKTENRRQIALWGVQSHSLFCWLSILGEEVGEMNKAALKAECDNKSLVGLRDEAIHAATMALKVAEMAMAHLA